MSDPKLYSYKLTYDTGFAPNPFHNVCTLATCKPGMRTTKQAGHWVAGFTSGRLHPAKIGDERLIYLMKITEVIPLENYWKEFPDKINKKDNQVTLLGDNIYKYEDKKFKHVENPHHPEDQLPRDTGGKNVLVAKEFYYFGKNALEIPSDVKSNVPRGPSNYGSLTDGEMATKFVEYVKEAASKLEKNEYGLYGMPHSWNEDVNCGDSCGQTAEPKESGCGTSCATKPKAEPKAKSCAQ